MPSTEPLPRVESDPYDQASWRYSQVYSTPEDEAESRVIFGIAEKEVGFGTLVDVGCGDGIALNYISGCDYVGVDPSRPMIYHARKLHPGHTFEVGTLESVPDMVADFVLGAFGPLIHIEPYEVLAFAKEVERVLWPGRKFLVMAATRGVVRATGEPRVTHTSKMLTKEFVSAGLLRVRVRGFGRRRGVTPSEGGRFPRRLWQLQKAVSLRAGWLLPDSHEWLVVTGAKASRT